MGMVRLRFTIRSLMITVAVIAGVLAVLTEWTEFLPVFIVVGIPLVGLTGLLARVPSQRPAWRLWIFTVMLGFMILGGGWLWARFAIGYFQWKTGSPTLQESAYHQAWGLMIPSIVTATGLIVHGLVLVIACVDRRRTGLLMLVVGYAFAMAMSWFLLFGLLNMWGFVD
jgi:hypothetical protein